jgi:DNA-binding response OmpR family regulator
MQNIKVAIIDHDKKSLKELGEILAGSGYTPIMVNEANLAVETVMEKKPDVILVELRMPHKNGFEITDSINRISATKKVPIIAMSQVFNDEFNWLLDLCGIIRCIKKPFLPLDVIWAVENELSEDAQLEAKRGLTGVEIIA